MTYANKSAVFRTCRFSFCRFEFDEQKLELKKNSEIIELKPKELGLISYLLKYPNRIISKESLIALCIAYLFSKRLTRQLSMLIDGIKQLSHKNFQVHCETKGIYKVRTIL